MLTSFSDDRPLLETAICSEDWKVVFALVDANADVNVSFSGEPLIFMQHHAPNITKPQHQPSTEDYSDTVCANALHAACFHKKWDLIYLLLERGANPNVVSECIALGTENESHADLWYLATYRQALGLVGTLTLVLWSNN